MGHYPPFHAQSLWWNSLTTRAAEHVDAVSDQPTWGPQAYPFVALPEKAL